MLKCAQKVIVLIVFTNLTSISQLPLHIAFDAAPSLVTSSMIGGYRWEGKMKRNDGKEMETEDYTDGNFSFGTK